MKKAVLTNNKGLSLLEVLVAVFVLALVALPLLNMFVFNTTLVRRAGDIAGTTYTAQSVMEDLQRLGYGELYAQTPLPGAKGSYELRSVTDSTLHVTRTVSIDRLPYGGFNNLVGGTACYAHLIVRGGSATFTGPDGVLHSGLGYSSGVTVSSSSITIGGSTFALNKPAGTNLILIIHAGTSAIPALTISLPSTVPYVLYALNEEDPVEQTITVSGGSASSRVYRKFNSKTDSTRDPPPDYLLVNAVCKVYGEDGSVESMVQNTIQARLP